MSNSDSFFDSLAKIREKAGIPETSLQVNTDDTVRVAQVNENIRKGFKQVWPHGLNNQQIAIVGGGWSLAETLDELRELYWDGVEIMALNGAGSYLMEHGIRPHAICILDAREHNLRFVETAIPKCKYFLASQVHPSLFDACVDRDTYIWHTAVREKSPEVDDLDTYYGKQWVEVPGSSTVGFRAVCLLRILGYEYMHLFGVDSCYSPEKKHHSYNQPENDGEEIIPFGLGGRKFHVSAWQMAQAMDFAGLSKVFGDAFHLHVHGDGLIAHMIRTGYESLADKAAA